ncbi:uncharacterized protein LOC130140567 isoform X2 [Syzygium oleosum]|uniref:uncharacterized protein LOC130140567 isoform X2 n=1 Tax=Syzygium oleosum TaxID=219896 RepID=UPI0024B9AE36|nr:uncharacterized protein LOC130140567 isoform X2 [Syzygium oleosum]
MKFQAPVPRGSQKITGSYARAGETGLSSGNSSAVFPDGQVPEIPVLRSTRHSRGNQEFIEELRTKADELERLFAEQKLRMSDDQFSSRWRSTDFNSQAIPPRVHEKQIMTESIRSSSGQTKFGTSPSVKTVGDQEGYADTNRKDISVNLRGKFYDEYMQRRDAKLRQEGGYKRALKVAKLKDMQADLEMNISELKAKLSGSVEGPDLNSGARSRIEKLRSFNIQSSTRMDEHTRALFCGEAEIYPDGQSDASPGVGSSRSSATKKHFSPIQDQSSSKPQTTTVPVPRPSLKPSNSISGRRRPQSEGSLVRSLPVIPNFSNTKKENKNPAPGLGRTAPRSQDRSFPRSKSTGEETKVYCAKEKTTRDSQATRKSSSSPSESKNLSAWNSNGAILESVRFDEEWVRPGLNEELVKSADSEAFPSNSDNLKYNDDFGALAFEAADMAKKTENDEEIKSGEVRYHATLDDGNSGSPNADSIGSHYSDLMSVSMLPRYYQHDLSEIDASVDSSVGSSISWSEPMVHAETGLVRTRKKWGNAQKPNIAGDSSQNESSKDAKKGFWLLKFGRSQVTESSVNRVSALTSDGDNAIEGGCRPPPKRSLEHLRQPVTGFLQDHSCSGSFTASDLFQEQVQALNRSIPAPPEKFKLRDDQQSLSGSSLKAPRSFFSLSSFRSKGRDLKVYH